MRKPSANDIKSLEAVRRRLEVMEHVRRFTAHLREFMKALHLNPDSEHDIRSVIEDRRQMVALSIYIAAAIREQEELDEASEV